MHSRSVSLYPERYPTRESYPFNLPLFHETREIAFPTPVTLFVGENGTGKSTLLEAIARGCGIHIWQKAETTRFEVNLYAKNLHRYLAIDWTAGVVPGSYFGSQVFHDFARMLDTWAAADPGQIEYFGGRSLLTQSHGQSILAFFRARYALKGLYLADEPETALSPRSQIALLQTLAEATEAGRAQFIIATHSPILLACPGATIYSFDDSPVRPIDYEETDHYKLYRSFMEDRARYLEDV